jgi:hypothetical protein
MSRSYAAKFFHAGGLRVPYTGCPHSLGSGRVGSPKGKGKLRLTEDGKIEWILFAELGMLRRVSEGNPKESNSIPSSYYHLIHEGEIHH